MKLNRLILIFSALVLLIITSLGLWVGGTNLQKQISSRSFLRVENHNPRILDANIEPAVVNQLQTALKPSLVDVNGVTVKLIDSVSDHTATEKWQMPDGSTVIFASSKSYNENKRLVIEVFLDIPQLQAAGWGSGVTASYLQSLIYQSLSEPLRDEREGAIASGKRLHTMVDPENNQFLIRIKL